jgi:hypothetical protein
VATTTSQAGRPSAKPPATTIVPRASIDPIDRSIMPVVSSMVAPTASSSGMARPRAMLVRLA